MLVAELISGELARAAGLKVPELVLLELDPVLGRAEPDSEIRDLLKASAGLNLAMDYLPASITFDPLAGPSRTRTWRAPSWPSTPSSPTWTAPEEPQPAVLAPRAVAHRPRREPLLPPRVGRLPRARAHALLPIKDHVLPWTEPARIREAWARLSTHLTPERVQAVVAAIPEGWLRVDVPFADVAAHRAAYVDYLLTRLAAAPVFIEEAARARAQLV